MSQPTRCPACGAGSLQSAGARRIRCAGCGTEFAYRLAWGRWLLTWALVGAALSLVAIWTGDHLGLGNPSTRLPVVGALTGALATALAGRFRTLRKV